MVTDVGRAQQIWCELPTSGASDCMFQEGRTQGTSFRCAAPSQGPRALALLTVHHDLAELYDCLQLDDEAGLSLDAPTLGDGLAETWNEAASALLPQLEACIADEAFSANDERALQRRLLAILLNPSGRRSRPRTAADPWSRLRAFCASSRTLMRARCGPRSLGLRRSPICGRCAMACASRWHSSKLARYLVGRAPTALG